MPRKATKAQLEEAGKLMKKSGGDAVKEARPDLATAVDELLGAEQVRPAGASTDVPRTQ